MRVGLSCVYPPIPNALSLRCRALRALSRVRPDVVPLPSPPSVGPSRSHLLPSTASCVAMNLEGTNNTATHGARRHLALGAASCVATSIAGSITSATHGACPPTFVDVPARLPPPGSGVDVVAKPDPEKSSATPTPLPSSRPLVALPPGGVGVSSKPDAITMTETSTPPAPASPIVLVTMGLPRIPASSSSHPAHPPPPPVWDEASAQAGKQSATAARRAGSLASHLRGNGGARGIGRLARRGSRDTSWPAGCPQRPQSASVHGEACVPVQFQTDAPAE